jgi:hypothetical protein
MLLDEDSGRSSLLLSSNAHAMWRVRLAAARLFLIDYILHPAREKSISQTHLLLQTSQYFFPSPARSQE